MAEIVVFNYLHKDTALHRMDGRIKLFCFLIFSISASLASEIPDFILLTVIFSAGIYLTKLPVISFLKQLIYFAALIIFVVVVDCFNIPGRPIPNLPIPGVSVEGLTTGLIFSWRLVLILMLCIIMTGATSLITLKNVIEWYLRPIPLIPESRVATMINLTFVFIPVIFNTVSEMSSAQKSRCIEGRKNPVKRLMFIAFPLLVQTFRRTDEIIFAMEARCYSEDRTRAVFKPVSKEDWFILAFTIIILLIILCYQY